MGKFFAAIIIAFMIGWLSPMCSHLRENVSTIPVPSPAVAPSEPVLPETVEAPVEALEPVPAQAPVPERAAPRLVTVAPYRSTKMFPEIDGGRYLVSILRANLSDVAATGARLAVAARVRGEIVERAQSGSGQTLPAGSTTYFGLPVSVDVFDDILDGPDDQSSALDWTLTYRFEDDAPGTTRCYGVSALPRRREPTGLVWRTFGQTSVCP